VRLVSGEIGEDLAHYLAQSEQASSAVLVGVLTRPTGVVAAGGLLVETLPGVSAATIAGLEANIERLGGPSRAVFEGGLAALEEAVLSGFERRRVERCALRYHCGCSRERLRQRLILLPPADRDHLFLESATLAAQCSFCGAEYDVHADDLLA
jgi:molecular chaperone Hsp33